MTVSVETGVWQLDQATSTIAIRHRSIWGLVTVNGTFTSFSGQGEVLADGTTRGTLVVDAASLDTKNAKRDQHLRSAEFFDVDRNPTITFSAHSVVPGANQSVQVNGQLTVRGVTRPLALTATVTDSSADAVTLTAEFTVDREQFEMTWNQLGMIRGLATVITTLRFTRTA